MNTYKKLKKGYEFLFFCYLSLTKISFLLRKLGVTHSQHHVVSLAQKTILFSEIYNCREALIS